MESWEKLIIVLGVLIFSAIAMYNYTIDVKTEKYMDNMKQICGILTDTLNDKIDENSTCVKYYCYYAPYAPPPGYEGKAKTLCACQCLTKEGNITTTQILSTI